MSSPAVPVVAVRPSAPTRGLAASLRELGSVLARAARAVATAVRAAGARIAQHLADALAIPPTVVLPLALAALVVLVVLLQARRG